MHVISDNKNIYTYTYSHTYLSRYLSSEAINCRLSHVATHPSSSRKRNTVKGPEVDFAERELAPTHPRCLRQNVCVVILSKCQAHMHRDAAHIGTPSPNEHLGICVLHLSIGRFGAGHGRGASGRYGQNCRGGHNCYCGRGGPNRKITTKRVLASTCQAGSARSFVHPRCFHPCHSA